MPKNTIDERVAELIFRDKEMARHVDHFTHKKTNHKTGLDFKKALYQDLLELASVYNAKSTNGVINPENTGVLAIPVEALKQYFGKE